MAREMRLPDLGEGLQEAEVISWHVSVGDRVIADQPLLSVEHCGEAMLGTDLNSGLGSNLGSPTNSMSFSSWSTGSVGLGSGNWTP